jgi:tetratricopeptide (TPR) repeat protein
MRSVAAACTFAMFMALGSRAHAAPPSAEASESDAAPGEDAPAKERARYWFKRGYEEATAERFEQAALAFDRSFEAIGAANTLFNAAYAFERAELPLEALSRYRLYLERFSDQPDSAEVERALSRLEGQLAEISVRLMGAEPPVYVEIAGERYAPEDFPIWVMPGELEIIVVDGRDQRRTDRILLRPGQRRVLEMTFVESVVPPDSLRPLPVGLQPDLGPSPDEVRLKKQAAQASWARPAFWGTSSVALAGGIGVTTFGLLTLRARRQFEEGLCVSPCEEGSTHPTQARERIGTYRTTTNAMIAVAGTGAILGVTFGLIWKRSVAAQKALDGPAEEAPKARLEPTATGLSLRF